MQCLALTPQDRRPRRGQPDAIFTAPVDVFRHKFELARSLGLCMKTVRRRDFPRCLQGRQSRGVGRRGDDEKGGNKDPRTKNG
jgi:hypothetical protein